MLQVEKRVRDTVTAVKRAGNVLVLQTARGLLRLEPMREDIVRVRYTRRAAFLPRVGVGLLPHAPVDNWNWEETGEEVCLSAGKLTLRVDKATSAIAYEWGGVRLLEENHRLPRELTPFTSYKTVVDENTQLEEVVTPDGVKKVIKNGGRVPDKELYHTRLHLQFARGEHLYGLGQAEEGTLDLRGTVQYLHQANRKIAVPLLVSSRGYGLLFATGSPAVFRDDAYGTYFHTEADEEMDYYFLAGGDLDGVVACSRFLTGKAAMLPRWAFGFVQSQERYETQEEILRIAEEHRRRGIGLDGIVLDWCSWEGDQWGQKSFDPGRFPDPKAMTDALHEKDVHFMISVWPNMNADTPNNEEFAKAGLLLPASDIYDAYSEEGRKLYWKQAEEGLFRYGVDAWWCDSSEPFTPEWSRPEKPGPEEMYREFADTAAQFVPAEVSNAYGLFHARAMYEGQRAACPEKRVLNLTRNGYSGQQRYGTVLWSGDTEATWETLKKQIPAGLNFCAAGLPYWTLDIGAFFVKSGVQWFWDGDYDDGLEDLGYRELFVRWYQLGAFLPMFRSHGTDVRREMWLFGAPFYDALLKMNRLRYRLLPYIYSLAGNVWRKDGTMLRLLAFDFPPRPHSPGRGRPVYAGQCPFGVPGDHAYGLRRAFRAAGECPPYPPGVPAGRGGLVRFLHQ